jgi:hypothetical protein
MTATATEPTTRGVEGCPELAVQQLLGYLTSTRDNLSIAIFKLTQQRDQLNRRIAEAKAILETG